MTRGRKTGILLVLFALVMLLWRTGPEWPWNAPAPQPADAIAGPAKPVVAAAPAAAKATIPPAATPAIFQVRSKVEMIQAAMLTENSRALDFYGRIVDQGGNPVEGMKVTAKVGTYEGFSRGGGTDSVTESDANGRFSFIGITGAGVGFLLDKEGYEYNQRLPSTTRPNDYRPDPSNPVIFRVWKLVGAEAMIHTKITAAIPCDGTATTFDLSTGRRSGDLQVTLTRNPLNIDRKKAFDWSLTVGMAGGGLIEIADAYPNEAPAEGYVPTVTVSMDSADKKWSSELTRSYYFEAHGGKIYGRVDIYVRADFQPPPTLFGAEIFANPSGSRNLEYDPSKLAN